MSKKRKRSKSSRGAAAAHPAPAPAAVSPQPAEAPPPAPASSGRIKLVAGIVAGGVILRFLFLGRADLWQDEMLMVMTADPTQSVFGIFDTYWTKHIVALAWLPLPAMVLNVWMSIFSGTVDNIAYSPLWLRMPGVLLASFGIWGMFLFSRRVLPWWPAVAATALMGMTFYPVFYARELHAYPLLLALSPFVLDRYFGCLFGDASRRLHYVLLAVLSLLLAYTHLTAPLLLAALAAVAGLTWLARLRKGASASARGALNTAIAVSVAGLLVAPVYLKILSQESPHLAEASSLSLPFMLNDFVSKLFLGDHVLPSVLGWAALVLGLTGLLRLRKPGERSRPRTMLAVFGLATVLILIASSRSQYLSARYFAVLAPFMFVVFAEGFRVAGSGLARIVLRKPAASAKVASALLTLFILVHLVVFLPPMYHLNNKSVDFGSIAEWLNANLAPGTPYVMESAYELRYVSGYHPTPGLVPAVPYVHGSRPDDLGLLHQRQRDFMLRFPESVFVQSAHHNYGQVPGMWPFPAEYFGQMVDLRDDALRSLVKMGIYPTHFRSEFNDMSFTTQIFFNSPEDIRNLARRRGDAALLTFPGWQVAQVAQYTYMRVVPGSRGTIAIENLTGEPVPGRLVLKGTFQGDGGAARVRTGVRWGDRTLGPFPITGQSLHVVETEELVLPPGTTEVTWLVVPEESSAVRALILEDARFVSAE